VHALPSRRSPHNQDYARPPMRRPTIRRIRPRATRPAKIAKIDGKLVVKVSVIPLVVDATTASITSFISRTYFSTSGFIIARPERIVQYMRAIKTPRKYADIKSLNNSII